MKNYSYFNRLRLTFKILFSKYFIPSVWEGVKKSWDKFDLCWFDLDLFKFIVRFGKCIVAAIVVFINLLFLILLPLAAIRFLICLPFYSNVNWEKASRI